MFLAVVALLSFENSPCYFSGCLSVCFVCVAFHVSRQAVGQGSPISALALFNLSGWHRQAAMRTASRDVTWIKIHVFFLFCFFYPPISFHTVWFYRRIPEGFGTFFQRHKYCCCFSVYVSNKIIQNAEHDLHWAALFFVFIIEKKKKMPWRIQVTKQRVTVVVNNKEVPREQF